MWNTLARVRQPVQREPYLERPLAARGVAPAQPGDRPGHTGCDPRGRRRRPDGPGQPLVGVRQHEAEHVPRRLDAEDVTFANPCFNDERPRPGRVRSDPGVPDVHGPAGEHRAGARQRRLPARGHLLVVRAGQARRPRHQGRRPVPVRHGRQLRAGQPERHVQLRSEQSSVRRQQSADLSRSPHHPRAG